jgi:hypothetical protein
MKEFVDNKGKFLNFVTIPIKKIQLNQDQIRQI